MGLSGSFLAQKRLATPFSSLYECSAGKIERFHAEIGSGEPPEAPVGTQRPGAPLTLLSLFPFVVVGNDRRGPPRNCCDRPLYLFVLGLKVGLLVRGRLPLAWFFAPDSPVGFVLANSTQKRPIFVSYVSRDTRASSSERLVVVEETSPEKDRKRA